jgi:hypothetical protein
MVALLVDPEFFDLFRTVEHTAFRLEVRDSYYEKEQEAQYLAGGPVDISYMDEWLALIVKARVAGKRVERVRVVSQPHSDYTRYGLWLCQYNMGAGEEIRYLARSNAEGLPNHDYWLLDSRRLYIVRFGEDDELLGAELVEDLGEVVRHSAWRDLAWHRATPHDEYVKATGVRVDCPASP